MAVYGYARCSTDESKQDINRQKRELRSLGVIEEENIYWEYESGTKTDRIQLDRLLGTHKQKGVVQNGDTVITTEVSRITRSTKQLCDIIELAQKKHIKLVIGAFIVDCSTGKLDPMTEGMLKMMGVFAEMERNIISERVKSGMKNAIANGKIVGRPLTTIENLPSNFLKYYSKYREGQINQIEFAKLCGLSRQSISKYIKIIKEQG